MRSLPRYSRMVNPHNAHSASPLRTSFDYMVIIIGIAPMALMVNWVLLPHAFVGGGLTGICSAIYYLTGGMFPSLFPEYGGAIPVWLTTFVFNAILLLIAGLTVGWRFCIRTMVGVAAITFWVAGRYDRRICIRAQSGLCPDRQRFIRRNGYCGNDCESLP